MYKKPKDPLVEQFKIKRFYALLFWRKCIKCKREFKFEHGTKFKQYNWVKKEGYSKIKLITHYVCSECCPSINTVKDLEEIKNYGK